MATATMTSKGQLTVPKEIRVRLGLKPGDKVEFLPEADEGRIIMRRKPIMGIAQLFRILPKGSVPVSPKAIDEAIGEEVLVQNGSTRE
ncbi:MAG: AbrB/MazE/SpoVT family DNA-binding domain-containing protein [Geminicoccaceae bacterium]